MESYLDLTLNQFLDLITDKKVSYQLTVLDDNTTIEGTLSELKDFISNLEKSELKTKLLGLLTDKTEYEFDYELNIIEIYNYLEKITSNFETFKSQMTLKDIEVYYSMEFRERIEPECQKLFEENKWEIPKIRTFNPILEKEYEAPDYELMLKKTHPFDHFNIEFAITLLKEKLKPKNKIEPNNWSHTIFKTPESLKTFENFMKEGKKNEYLADCSFIYRMMHDRLKPSLIHEHIKPGSFRSWLNENYPDNEPLTSGLKTWENIETIDREKRYNRAKKTL